VTDILVTDLVLLGARRKVLLVARHHGGFSAVPVSQSEYEALVAGRPVFAGKTLQGQPLAIR
jgi:hypothetical protein